MQVSLEMGQSAGTVFRDPFSPWHFTLQAGLENLRACGIEALI